MAIPGDPELSDTLAVWRRRMVRARLVLAAAGAVFLGLALMEALTLLQGLAGFVIVAGAALFDVTKLGAVTAPTSQTATPLAADWLIETVIAGLPDPVIVLERDGLVLASNGPARAIAASLMRGAPLSFALRAPDVLDAVRHAARNAETRRVEFFQRVPSDRWFEAFVVPVMLPESIAGRRDLIIVTLHDLTPLRRVEEMRVDFVANASHELRTPLASLSGFIDTLQGPARDDPQARERFLAIMKEQANRMARLIDDLLSLSRIELKAHVQPGQHVDIAAIVRQVVDGLQTLARDREVDIVVDLPSESLIVRGDRDELIRVFENLVENALKYGASGRRVDIAVMRAAGDGQGGEAIVTVRDYGPGIAPEHLPRLTERFYRVDVADSRAQGGTGLGLALVKHILHRHRGLLVIASERGKGATFTVRLPMVATESATPPESFVVS